MELKSVKTEQAFEAWDRYVRMNPEATFFHLSGWKKVVEKTLGYQALYSCIVEGGRIRGILPLFHVKSFLFGGSLVAVPLGVYGGICSDHQTSEAVLLDHATKQAEEMGVKYLELRHRKPIQGNLCQKDLYVAFEREMDSDPDKNMAAIPRKQRRMIRQGQKAGLEARIGGIEFLSRFYDIYAHSVRNLGTPVFSRRLFENLLVEFGQSCRIFTIWREGKMMAGVMTFFFRDRVMPYYGGALKEAFCYAVNDFMYWELMQYAAQKGYKIFDFGRSKRGSGSYDFKRHWGFEPMPLAYQYHLVWQKSIPDLSPFNPKFSLAIKIWRHLPVSLTKLIGPLIAKQLG